MIPHLFQTYDPNFHVGYRRSLVPRPISCKNEPPVYAGLRIRPEIDKTSAYFGSQAVQAPRSLSLKCVTSDLNLVFCFVLFISFCPAINEALKYFCSSIPNTIVAVPLRLRLSTVVRLFISCTVVEHFPQFKVTPAALPLWHNSGDNPTDRDTRM